MGLWAYALATVGAAKSALGIKSDLQDGILEDCINQASALIEGAWGRNIVSRGSLTEFHTYDCARGWRDQRNVGVLHLLEWPIVSVTTVHEDNSRVFATPLVVDTDYTVSKPAGRLIRVSGSLPIEWATGWRAIKVVYLGGYQNTEGTITGAQAVPADVLRVFYELLGWMFKQRANNDVGLTQAQDAFGNRVFSGPAYITPGMQAALSMAGAIPASLTVRTGERDA